jgi:hypothetical protein
MRDMTQDPIFLGTRCALSTEFHRYDRSDVELNPLFKFTSVVYVKTNVFCQNKVFCSKAPVLKHSSWT